MKGEPKLDDIYTSFRDRCLKNVDDLLNSANSLKQNSVNHICFHLIVLALEEIGKVFIVWRHLNNLDKYDQNKVVTQIDDHVKKLFWSIWAPTLGKEVITGNQVQEYKQMASGLHRRRLGLLYTNIEQGDSSNINDDELGELLAFANARYELSKIEYPERLDGTSKDQSDDLAWLFESTENKERSNFIFGMEAQKKLVELKDVKEWVKWLRSHFDKEQFQLQELLKHEMKRESDKSRYDSKWRITIKLFTPSHSIRQKALNEFNERVSIFHLKKGKDSNILYLDVILTNQTNVKNVWHEGWLLSRIYVAALNVSTNGLFYWNIERDVDKYYTKIWDVENEIEIKATLAGTRLDWPKNKVLTFDQLILSKIVVDYFAKLLSTQDESLNHFLEANSMLAKSDIHLNLELICFMTYYASYKKAVNLVGDESADKFEDIGYFQIDSLLTNRDEYDKIIDLAKTIDNKTNTNPSVSLTEIIAIKQYASLLYLTLAVRNQRGDNSIKLTVEEE